MKEKPKPDIKTLPLPEFRSEDEERKFWAEHDSTQFIDWLAAKPGRFPSLRRSDPNLPTAVPQNGR